jgi:hypothetical protein
VSKKVEYVVLEPLGAQGVLLVNTAAQCVVARRKMAALKIVRSRVYRASDKKIEEVRRYLYADGRSMTGACHKAKRAVRRAAPRPACKPASKPVIKPAVKPAKKRVVRRHGRTCRCLVCVRS